MDVNDYYAEREEYILGCESWSEEEKQEELHLLKQQCQQIAEEEAARDAEADGYRRYI